MSLPVLEYPVVEEDARVDGTNLTFGETKTSKE